MEKIAFLVPLVWSFLSSLLLVRLGTLGWWTGDDGEFFKMGHRLGSIQLTESWLAFDFFFLSRRCFFGLVR
ncbi:hypothetical protein F5B19DRAFT_452520 [Rostrohypoxylon terebratum]|nr:hypothetical protein F5B19DRAFT_452520 [Rostrohypoxylon terebratum]